MGHLHVAPGRTYQKLQQKLDAHVTGAPDSPVLQQILRLLYSRDDLRVAMAVPLTLASLESIAGKLGETPQALQPRLDSMATRGLVMDLEHEGQRFYTLSPIAIGFFEFTFMRTRGELPQKELARLFDQYMYLDDRFARSVFAGETQLGRALAREDTLPEDGECGVLDWERATHIVKTASNHAVSLCACRHKEHHLDRNCGAALDNCLSFDTGAEVLTRNGLARLISREESLDILQTARDSGLMQTADNVRQGVSYICNCCSCCCGMLQAIRRFEIPGAIVPSGFIVQIEHSVCNGCGLCAATCPVEALEVKEKNLILAMDGCLGCGLCIRACRRGALKLERRVRPPVTPETLYDRILAMAVERGKLAEMLFADSNHRPGHRALGRMLTVLERSRPVRALVAIRPLRSLFLQTLVQGIRSRHEV